MIRNPTQTLSAGLPPRQRGVSLLEVLVALALFVNGMLGIFSLYATSLARQQQAYQRTQSLLLAADPAWRKTGAVVLCPPDTCDPPEGSE